MHLFWLILTSLSLSDCTQMPVLRVLAQVQGGKERVIAYASRSASERNDQNYSSFKLELLALKWAITEKFLYGAEFTISFTDNNHLVHLETARLGAVEQRWGRRPVCVDQVMTEDGTWEERQARDPDLAQIRQWKEQQLSRPKVCCSPSRYMKQLLGQWNKIVLRKGVLGRLCDIGSDD